MNQTFFREHVAIKLMHCPHGDTLKTDDTNIGIYFSDLKILNKMYVVIVTIFVKYSNSMCVNYKC